MILAYLAILEFDCAGIDQHRPALFAPSGGASTEILLGIGQRFFDTRQVGDVQNTIGIEA